MICSSTDWHETGLGCYVAKVCDAEFHFRLAREELPFREICDVALRNNSMRRFLFVSRVLGRHWPVRPVALREVARLLANKAAQKIDGPAVFIGMAETATTLGQAVFREWRRLGREGLYLESTRRRTGGEVAFPFSESHSHATAHLVHLPDEEDDPAGLLLHCPHIVIVDDEATTAATAVGLVRALRAWRGEKSFEARLAVLLHWNAGATNPAELTGIDSLVEGCFDFTASGELSDPNPPRHSADTLIKARRGPRHGIHEPEEISQTWIPLVNPGERILVIGNGEHGFRPLVLAEALESLGAEAWLQATTRSPILSGGAIGHIRSFHALSGEEYVEYLYNVPDEHGYDRVILCTEDAPPCSEHSIWQIPTLEVVS